MAETANFTLKLAKEDFKFSAAHFTLFPDGSAELLHGHDYRVRVQLSGSALDEHGLLLDLAAAKERIREICARLDEHTLIPEKSSLLELRADADQIEVHLGERSYRLPRSDVTLLPLSNITIELLARLVWEELAPALSGTPAELLVVEVEETPGQACAYQRALSKPG